MDVDATLLRPDVAQRELGTTPHDIVSALTRADFRSVAALVGPEGLCLRPSKGGECARMSAEEFAACGDANAPIREWSVDTGADELPRASCRDAIARFFLSRDFTRAEPQFNQLPEECRGNNCASVVLPPAGDAYVELIAPTDEETGEQWRSLWLVFAGQRGCMHLTEIMSEGWSI